MKKKFAKGLLVFGAFILFLAGVLFLFRTGLLAYGLTLFLEKQGARQVRVTVTRVDSDQIVIEGLDFTLRRGNRLLKLELKDLTVRFVPAELRQGQVQDIILQRLRLRESEAVGRLPGEAATPFDLPNLLIQLNSDWQNLLPFRNATIAALQLSGPNLPPALTQPLTLTLARTDSGVKVRCRPISSSGSADVRVLLEKDGETLSLNAVAMEKGELVATLVGEWLDVSFSFDPAQLNSLLVPFGGNAIKTFDQFSSSDLTGNFTANLKRWPLFDLQAQFAARDLTLVATKLKGITCALDLKAVDLENLRRPFQVGQLQVGVEQFFRADLELSGVEGLFALTATTDGTYRLDEASTVKIAAFKNADRSLQNAKIQIRPEEFTLNLTQLDVEGRAIALAGKVQTQKIAIAAAGRKASLRNAALDFSLTTKELRGEGQVRIGPIKQPLVFSMQHEFVSGRGDLKVSTPTPLALNPQVTLSRLLEPWSFSGDAVAGRIDLTFDADWAPQKETTAVAGIRLDGVDGTWRDLAFNGLSLVHRIKIWPRIESLDRALLEVNRITSGVPITDARATLRLRQADRTLETPLFIELEEGHFTLLDSIFSIKPFTYKSDEPKKRIWIETARLDLTQLTPLYENQGLRMSGLVDVVLPVEVGVDGVEIVDGALRQNGPGVINYRPPDREMLKRAGLPDIVFKALEEFHYDHLAADVAYQPAGQLILGVRLHGKSPTAGTERPFQINLKLEQNLLSLLKSLRYSDVFDRQIEDYMKKNR